MKKIQKKITARCGRHTKSEKSSDNPGLSEAHGVEQLTKRTYWELSHSTFDDVVRQNYGMEYSYTNDYEAANDSEKAFIGIEAEPLSKTENNRLFEFRRTGSYSFMAHVLLKDMCYRGLIPPGDYLIRVCW